MCLAALFEMVKEEIFVVFIVYLPKNLRSDLELLRRKTLERLLKLHSTHRFACMKQLPVRNLNLDVNE